MTDATAAVLGAFRSEYGRTVAILARTFRDLDLVEDAVQDAFAAAADLWPTRGVPPNPQAWIVTTARNRAEAEYLDHLKRAEAMRRDHSRLILTGSGVELIFEPREARGDDVF